MNLKIFIKNVLKWGKKHSPEILTGVGIVGMGATVVSTAKIAPVIKEETSDPDMPVKEKAKLVLKRGWPVGVMFGASTAAIIGSNRISAKRCAGLLTAYTTARSELNEYMTGVAEEVGIETAKNIRNKVMGDRLADIPAPEPDMYGRICYYDQYSDRYFYSTKEDLRKIQNDLNARILSGEDIYLNEVYNLIGLGYVEYGDNIGWRYNPSVVEMIEFQMDDEAVITPDGKPALVFSFVTYPDVLPSPRDF